MRLAAEAERKKEWDNALKALQRASDLAKSQADSKTVLNLQIRLAKILEEQGKHRLAADHLTTNAIEYAAEPVASAAHLIGCWNYAKSISAKDPNSRPAFQNAAHPTPRAVACGNNFQPSQNLVGTRTN